MAKIDFQKLSNATHETKATVKVDGVESEIVIRFRGVSFGAERKLQEMGAFIEKLTEAGAMRQVKFPEFCFCYVVDFVNEGETFAPPDLDWWLGADPAFVEAVFDAVNEARVPKPSTPNGSPPSSATESLAD